MIKRRAFNSLRWIFLGVGLILLVCSVFTNLFWGKIILFVLACLFMAPGLILIWWFARPNKARIAAELELESWDVVNDQFHNSNTDMICLDGTFYLVHAIHRSILPILAATWRSASRRMAGDGKKLRISILRMKTSAIPSWR
jgi:hypothetical protein